MTLLLPDVKCRRQRELNLPAHSELKFSREWEQIRCIIDVADACLSTNHGYKIVAQGELLSAKHISGQFVRF